MLSYQEFSDGIAFYLNYKEVAFYSFITERIRYNENCYSDFVTVGCAEVPLEYNKYMMNIIKEYTNFNEA